LPSHGMESAQCPACAQSVQARRLASGNKKGCQGILFYFW
jgi:hypothetical protein